MAEIEESAPLRNITPGQLATASYNPPVFGAIYSLLQAWPLLHDEIEQLEARNAALVRENVAMAVERRAMVEGATRATNLVTAERAVRDREVATLRDQLVACRRQLAGASAEVASFPERTRLAEKVLASIDPHHGGKGGTWAWFDGEALDAWRRAKGAP